MKKEFDIKKIHKVIETPELLKKQYLCLDGFAFTELTQKNVFDALIIRETLTAFCIHDAYSIGSRTLTECIELINKFMLESVIVIANDLSFLKQCPTVKHFVFYLNLENQTLPKMSYLSTVPGIRNFRIDGISGVEELYTGGVSPFFFQKLKSLKFLNMSGTDRQSNNKSSQIQTIENFDLPELLKLDMMQCNISSLSGIEKCPKLQWLSLFNMRNLSDISMLDDLAPTLRLLSIENCPKIEDFNVIEKLKNLEYLELCGKNEIPSLEFIKGLPNLKFLKVSMNILDGDVSPCLDLQYADVVCKKHYNLSNKKLPKDKTEIAFVLK